MLAVGVVLGPAMGGSQALGPGVRGCEVGDAPRFGCQLSQLQPGLVWLLAGAQPGETQVNSSSLAVASQAGPHALVL